jgi:D-xylono/L-arabinono-1,4-lactonase
MMYCEVYPPVILGLADLRTHQVNCDIGEGPIWHEAWGLLLFVDIPAGVVYSYDPSTDRCEPFSAGPVTAAMTLQENGDLLLFQDGRCSLLGRDGIQHELATDLCPGNERFNDVTADPMGRVYAGTMGGNGRLFRFDPNGTITEVMDGLGIPNGMGFTADLRHMYVTDSVTRTIYLLDYSSRTGQLTNKKAFAEIPMELGVPDGMAVDAQGNVCSAIWFGGRIRKYAPDGRLRDEVLLPAPQTSAIAFGGPDYSTVFVTTAATRAADSLKPPNFITDQPRGGPLYSFHLEGWCGTPPFRSKIQLPFRPRFVGRTADKSA